MEFDRLVLPSPLNFDSLWASRTCERLKSPAPALGSSSPNATPAPHDCSDVRVRSVVAAFVPEGAAARLEVTP